MTDAAHKRGVARRIEPPQNPPQNLAVLAYTGRLDISWDAPNDDGGPAITGYAVRYSSDGGTTWLTTNVAIDGRSASITGLTNGTTYTLGVVAVSLLGPGTYATIEGTPTATQRAPGTPTGLTLTPGNERVTVSWTAPRDLGNPPLTGYSVQYREVTTPESGWSDWPHTGTGTSTTITGLTSDRPYEVQVAAVNASGPGGADAVGPYSDVETIALVRVPGAPALLTLFPRNGIIALKWRAPADPGLPVLHGYSVQYREQGAADWIDWTHTGTGTDTDITGLTNGQEYLVRVAAVNTQGTGPYTPPEKDTPFARADLPGPPRNLVLTPGDGKIDVSWDAPSDRGNPPLKGYWMHWRKPGQPDRVLWYDDTGDTVRRTITGLTNGQAYEVWVRAGNDHGGGPQAGPKRATPEKSTEPPEPDRPPTAPRNLTLTPGDEQIEVTWDPPADLGKPEMRDAYFVEFRRAGRGRWQSAGEYRGTGATIDYLENGVEYEVRVVVFNTQGEAIAGPKWATPSASGGDDGSGDGDTNQPPTADAGLDQSVTVGSTVTLDGSGTDPEGETLTYAWTAPSGITLSSNTVASPTFTAPDRDGDYTLTFSLVVNDGASDSAPDTVVISVTASEGEEPDPKRPPTAPRNLSLTTEDETIKVSWDPPEDIGEPDDWLGYVVEIREVGERDWFEDGFYKGTSATIDYLENGTTYEVRVIAFNLHGEAATEAQEATPSAG